MYLNNADFPFVSLLENAFSDIQQECLNLPATRFDPWIQREMYSDGWSVYGLIAWGYEIDKALSACPITSQILKEIPGVQTAGFSRLAPGTHIQPHRGWVTNVYRLHLGLVVPEDCAMRVGEETRSWQEGKCLVFDDTSEHEAWNKSDRDRFILLLDFLRPGCEPSDNKNMPPEVKMMLAKKLLRSKK